MVGEGESARDRAKAAGRAAKKRLGTYVHLLQMVVDQQKEIANQLSQIVTTITLANGLEEEGDAGEEDADGRTGTDG